MSQFESTAETVRLSQAIAGAEFHGADVALGGCTDDSRTVKPGDIFVAVRGAHADGHDFIDEAVARGAAAVIAERPVQLDLPWCLVGDSREALGQLCQALAGHPAHDLKVIGVTGTNGKTTTTHLIASILQAAGLRTGLVGTLGYHDSLASQSAPWTTPPAAVLAEWLARMKRNHCTHAVLEVSSHAIAERRIAGIQFTHVALTNLRRDHLDYHASLADYHRTKIGLFAHLSGGVAVVNADDAASMAAAPLLPGGVLSVGIHEAADITAMVVERSKSEQTFLISAGRVTQPVRTAMIGDHHVYNCLAAAAVGLVEGIDLVTIARGLEAVGHLPGRLERIECGQPFGVYVDFAHTPDALSVVLAAVREVTIGRVLCVFGAGGNRDAQKRPLMGRAVEAQADVAILTTDNPRFEDPRAIAAEILAGFERPGDARWLPEREGAIEYALSLAGPDDSVVIAGRGHETHQIISHERRPLDDRQVARRFLYNLASSSQYAALASSSQS